MQQEGRIKMYQHNLKVLFLLVVTSVFHEAVPAEETLSSYLWEQTSNMQLQALNSTFVQGVKNASLDPTKFGSYMVQDAIYMYKSKLSLDIALNRTADPDLKKFLQETTDSYERIYKDMFSEWNIAESSGIRLGDACSRYTDLIDKVASDPLYLVVTIIPCVRLWPWIGKQIFVDTGSFGVYTKWAKASFDPNYKGYKDYEKIIDDAFRKGTVEKGRSLELYQESMKGEVDFFNLL